MADIMDIMQRKVMPKYIHEWGGCVQAVHLIGNYKISMYKTQPLNHQFENTFRKKSQNVYCFDCEQNAATYSQSNRDPRMIEGMSLVRKHRAL